ncbi:hypothetical protein EYF80_020168 [Liparis tanakae]|uniref:Uncharacterized protein n=1 Tax=Liparis tanakae TaxID=230148 RepID=A0A4Z2HX81_9TELE|nr:hypothetical protein EYF80_020168 [Liparis tanakae]
MHSEPVPAEPLQSECGPEPQVGRRTEPHAGRRSVCVVNVSPPPTSLLSPPPKTTHIKDRREDGAFRVQTLRLQSIALPVGRGEEVEGGATRLPGSADDH